MKYNQQAVDDLLSPLRYVNLKDIDANSINRIGEGVFPELTTLDHLSILDLVTKAYQAVHLPTLGQPIPKSTNVVTVNQTDSQTEQTLITANNNETLEIMSISGTFNGLTSGISSTTLQIYNLNTLTAVPFMDLPRVEAMLEGFSGIVYGHMLDFTTTDKFISTPNKLLLTGGESLQIKTKSAPDSTITWSILYRKVSQ